jgi:long-chain acyl-CoA synthetase
VSLDPDNIRAWADKNGVEGEYRDIVGDARTRAMLDQLVASEVNAKLERWERVVKFAVAEEEFTVTNGFLTPSNKVVRHTVLNTYGQQIDALYEER